MLRVGGKDTTTTTSVVFASGETLLLADTPSRVDVALIQGRQTNESVSYVASSLVGRTGFLNPHLVERVY